MREQHTHPASCLTIWFFNRLAMLLAVTRSASESAAVGSRGRHHRNASRVNVKLVWQYLISICSTHTTHIDFRAHTHRLQRRPLWYVSACYLLTFAESMCHNKYSDVLPLALYHIMRIYSQCSIEPQCN